MGSEKSVFFWHENSALLMEIYIFGAGGHEIMNIKSDDNAAIESLYDLAVSGIAINLY
jgi:hypothetical protein